MKKGIIIGLIIGIAITSMVAVIASDLTAGSITYKPQDTNWNVNNVESALNELKTVASTYKKLDSTTTAKAVDILSGKTAYDNNGNLITGSLVTDCVMGSISTSDGYNTSTDKLVTSLKPSIFLLYPGDSKWDYGIHFYSSVLTGSNFSASSVKGGASYSVTSQALSKYYTINNNGWYIHSWPSGYNLKYIACK